MAGLLSSLDNTPTEDGGLSPLKQALLAAGQMFAQASAQGARTGQGITAGLGAGGQAYQGAIEGKRKAKREKTKDDAEQALIAEKMAEIERTKAQAAQLMQFLGPVDTGAATGGILGISPQERALYLAMDPGDATKAILDRVKPADPQSGAGKLAFDLARGLITKQDYDALIKKQTYIAPTEGAGGQQLKLIPQGDMLIPQNYDPSAGTLSPIPGAQPAPRSATASASGKPLPTPAINKLTDMGAVAESSSRFAQTFRPEYGGHTALGDLSNTAGRMLGDETGQSQWWQDYTLHASTVRNKLFGSALTATEVAEWDKSTISPRMEPGQIAKNLARREKIERKGLARQVKTYATGRYIPEQIEAATGMSVDDADAILSGKDTAAPVDAQGGIKFLGFE